VKQLCFAAFMATLVNRMISIPVVRSLVSLSMSWWGMMVSQRGFSQDSCVVVSWCRRYWGFGLVVGFGVLDWWLVLGLHVLGSAVEVGEFLCSGVL